MTGQTGEIGETKREEKGSGGMKGWTGLLAAVLALSLCACQVQVGSQGDGDGGSHEAAAITKEDGTVEELTREELEELKDSNEIAYNEHYLGCALQVSGTVESIEQTREELFDNVWADCARFTLEEGWTFFFTLSGLEEDGIDVSALTTGSAVEVSGTLGETDAFETEIEGAHDLVILEEN